MYLYNSATHKKEELKTHTPNHVEMYTCGPTVYHFAHIGNLRSYIMEDVLEKYLRFAGYSVDRVMNITDVGHLTSDADEGEDKMLKGAKREHKSVMEIAQFYTDAFFADCQKLHIKRPDVVQPATGLIDDYIKIISKLLDTGYAYLAGGNVYFDTSKLDRYYIFNDHNEEDLAVGVREGVEEDTNKKNKNDFVLWFTKSKFEDQALKWDAPWGVGDPGWHIECSVMSKRYLGEEIDIHAGGEDLIFPHHENEIAQSEAANDKPFARYWMHNAFLNIDNRKMSKSLGNVINPDEVVDQYGADTMRLYEMFMGDFEQAAPWQTSAIAGCNRFLARVWALSDKLVEGAGYRPQVETLMHQTIKKVGADIEGLKMNTAIAQLMTLVNALYDNGGATKAELETVVQLLNPFAPHMTEELWEKLGHSHDEQLAYYPWPKYEEAKCVESTVEIAVQVNGKVKAKITVAAAAAEEDVKAQALAAVSQAIEGKDVKKVVVVKGRLVDIVAK